MPGGERLWRTADGDLVKDGDPRAVSLAYGPHDDLEGDDLKAVKQPANKQAKKPDNK